MEGGIRTHGSVATTPDFESGTFDHSATSPAFVSKPAIIARFSGLEHGGAAQVGAQPASHQELSGMGRLMGKAMHTTAA